MPMWLICSCFSTCCCNASGIIIHLPFITTQSITASWFWFSGYPCMTYFMKHWKWWSWDVASCSSCIVIHAGMLEIDCIVLMLIHRPVISLSLFSLWFCLDNQSAMNRPHQGLSMISTLYWCILHKIYWNLCDNVATSFLYMAMSGLWSIIILTSLAKQ